MDDSGAGCGCLVIVAAMFAAAIYHDASVGTVGFERPVDFKKERTDPEIEKRVSEYRATLPNYNDSIKALDAQYKDKMIQWQDSIELLRETTDTETFMKLHYNIVGVNNKKCHYYNKRNEVKSQVKAYRSKLYKEQQRRR